MYGAVHIFVGRSTVVKVEIVSINKVLQGKIQQT